VCGDACGHFAREDRPRANQPARRYGCLARFSPEFTFTAPGAVAARGCSSASPRRWNAGRRLSSGALGGENVAGSRPGTLLYLIGGGSISEVKMRDLLFYDAGCMEVRGIRRIVIPFRLLLRRL